MFRPNCIEHVRRARHIGSDPLTILSFYRAHEDVWTYNTYIKFEFEFDVCIVCPRDG